MRHLLPAAAAASVLVLAGCSLVPGGDAAPPVERVEETIGAAPGADAPPEEAPPEEAATEEAATEATPDDASAEETTHTTVVLDLEGTSTVGSPGPVVASGWLEAEIRAGLADERRVQVQSVDCPEDLPARAGSVLRCELTMRDGAPLAADVVVEEVDGAQVSMPVHLLPADSPETTVEDATEGTGDGGVPAALVQDFAVAEFRAETDRNSIAICPGNLPAQEGAGMVCTLYAGSQHATVQVTVDAVTAESVDFSIVID